MIIRAMTPADVQPLKEIHEFYFKDDFPFPDFTQHFLNAFVVVNDHDEIITAGGVRTILESIVVTNRSMSAISRRDALNKILLASMYTAGHYGYEQIHAFVSDDKWKKRLMKTGFNKVKGSALFIGA